VDIAIDPKILRSRQLQAWGRPALAVVVLAVLLVLLRQWLTPSVSREEIRTAVVEQGAISTEVAASGTVVPKTERVVISPVTSSIHEVYLPLGSRVTKGDAILKLDSAQIERELARLRDELRLKDLEIEGLRQQQQQVVRDLRNRQALAAIDFENQNVTLQRFDTLRQSNIVSQFDYETAVLNAKKTELQLQQLEQQVGDTLASDSNALAQREIEKQLLTQQLAEQQRVLHETTIHASGDGIITVLSSELGQNIVVGSELVRISDVSGYRVDATLSDFYLHQIAVGMPVNVDLGTGTLTGRLAQILPAIDNGTIGVQIELDDPANTQLKPNLRVEAGIVTEQRSSGLRVTNGVVFNGPGRQALFVVQDGEAVKRDVEVGLINSKHVEIRSGLTAGEEIVISDMSDYQHLAQISLND
jgi:HlyD family secretion protein